MTWRMRWPVLDLKVWNVLRTWPNGRAMVWDDGEGGQRFAPVMETIEVPWLRIWVGPLYWRRRCDFGAAAYWAPHRRAPAPGESIYAKERLVSMADWVPQPLWIHGDWDMSTAWTGRTRRLWGWQWMGRVRMLKEPF